MDDRSAHLRVTLLLSCSLVAGCADDPSASDPGTTSSSTGEMPASTGEPTTDAAASTTSLGTSADDTAGSTTADVTASGTTAPADTGGLPGDCSMIDVAGQIDGEDLDQTIGADLSVWAGVVRWGHGNVFYFPPSDSDGSPTQGLLRLADDAPAHGGELFCAGEGTTATLGTDLPGEVLHLESFTALGACPGEPVAGELAYDPLTGVTSTVEGIDPAVSSAALGSSLIPPGIAYGELALSDAEGVLSGYAYLRPMDPQPTDVDGSTVALLPGLLRAPVDAAGEAPFYCFGAQSTIDYVYSTDPPSFEITGFRLTDLRRVPDCPSDTPVDGALDVSHCPQNTM